MNAFAPDGMLQNTASAPAHSGDSPNTLSPSQSAIAGNAISFNATINISVGVCPLIS